MFRGLSAIFGISWFWFYSASALTLYSSYGKTLLHVRQSVITLFLVSFALGVTAAYGFYYLVSRRVGTRWFFVLGSIGMSLFPMVVFFIGRPTFAHSFITLGIREFLSYSDGLYILASLTGLSVSCGFFVGPLYSVLSEFVTVSKVVATTNNVSSVLFILLSGPFLYYVNANKMSISQTFLIIAICNGVVGTFLSGRFRD